MRIKALILAFGFICLSFTQTSVVFKSLYEGLGQGNTENFYKYLDEYVTITFNNTQNIYSKKQADAILDRFFGETHPYKFVILNDGNNLDKTSKYSIGNLYTKEKIYKILLFFKLRNNSFYLQQMKIE